MGEYKNFRYKLEAIADKLGEFIAIVALLVFVFNALNLNFHWLTNDTAVSVLTIINTWAGFLLIAVVGFEASIKWPLLAFRIIYYVFLAAGIIILFFPGTYEGLIAQAQGLLAK